MVDNYRPLNRDSRLLKRCISMFEAGLQTHLKKVVGLEAVRSRAERRSGLKITITMGKWKNGTDLEVGILEVESLELL